MCVADSSQAIILRELPLIEPLSLQDFEIVLDPHAGRILDLRCEREQPPHEVLGDELILISLSLGIRSRQRSPRSVTVSVPRSPLRLSFRSSSFRVRWLALSGAICLPVLTASSIYDDSARTDDD